MVKIFRLPNGITGVCEEHPGAGIVSMRVSLATGGMHEAMEENGLTNLTQEACFGGTTTRSREQVAAAIEEKGGSFSSKTIRTDTHFSVKALTRHAAETFGVLADIVRNPAFAAAEVEKTKQQIFQSIIEEDQQPAAKTPVKFYEAAFNGQAAGNNPLGTEEMVASFTAAQLKKKHAEMLSDPAGIVVSFAGDIDAAQAEKLLRAYFSDLPAGAPRAVPSLQFTALDSREAAENDQLNIRFGFRAPPAKSLDGLAAMMLAELLAGGMSSPLFQEVREKRGLVYGVNAGYRPVGAEGIFTIAAGAGEGNAGELVSVSMDLLGKVAREGFDDAAFARARERLVRARKENMETAADAAGENAEMMRVYGDIPSLEKYEEQLKQVTSDDVRRVCIGMMQGGSLTLAAIGPLATLQQPQEIRDLIRKQLAGVTAPQQQPKTPLSSAAAAAQKETRAQAEPQITILPNGLKIVTVERAGTLSCGAWVGTGSDSESPARNGIKHMNEHMMFKGTDSYAAGEIDKIIEGQMSGDLNAYTFFDRTAYYFYNLNAGALEKTLHIAGEMIFKATLDHAEFDGKTVTNPDGTTAKNKGERDVVIEELRRANDNVDELFNNTLMATAYPGQAHGRPILGTNETLRAMTVQDLAEDRKEFYVPGNVVFCAVGPVKHADVVAAVTKMYGQMPAAPFPALPVPGYTGGTACFAQDDRQKCKIAVNAPATALTDPDYPAWEAMNIILGHGMSSRLYRNVVNKLDLSTGIQSGVMGLRNSGLLTVEMPAEPEKIKPLINAVYAEMRSLAAAVTQPELDRAAAIMEMALLSSRESNRAACDTFAVEAQDATRLKTLPEALAEIRNVTLDDVRRAVNRLLQANPTVIVSTPPGVDPRYLPSHDDVLASRDGKTPPASPQSKPKDPAA